MALAKTLYRSILREVRSVMPQPRLGLPSLLPLLPISIKNLAPLTPYFAGGWRSRVVIPGVYSSPVK